MSWRTVVIGNRAKLDFKMNYMIVRKDDEVTKIFISEIYMVIIESTAVSMTAVLLNELVKAKVKIVFCDEKRNPASEILSIYGCHNTSRRCREQINWSAKIKSRVWHQILRTKIGNQANLLKSLGKTSYNLVDAYRAALKEDDPSMNEGHAARVYFTTLFGHSFSREQDNNINAALNYGYSLLLSAINREIVGMGYLTQLGLFHSNQFNPFNLGSDFIEPLRGIVDRLVVTWDHKQFERSHKYQLVELLSEDVQIDGQIQVLSAAIKIYCKSIFDALNNEDINLIRFISYEL